MCIYIKSIFSISLINYHAVILEAFHKITMLLLKYKKEVLIGFGMVFNAKYFFLHLSKENQL